MTPQEKKDFVVEAYQTLIGKGDLSRIDYYMRDDYIQHSPHATDGKEGFIEFVHGFRSQFPDVQLHFKRVICEGDYVVTHCHGVFYPGHLGVSVMDIFRLEDGKLAEHWEAFIDIPENTRSGRPIV